jgi:hypothetical protein
MIDSPISPYYIWNCPEAFELLCPKQWDELLPTDSDNIRHCNVCSEDVYFSPTPAEFVRNCHLGRCVSIPSRLLQVSMTGRVSVNFIEQVEKYRETLQSE